MRKNKSERKNQKGNENLYSLDGVEIYGCPIIGYDRNFWKYCKETNKEKIASYKKNEKRKKVSMECDKKHSFYITPYMYFVEQRTCPYCICKDDIGASNLDETIYSFWNDKRFELECISENSKELFRFKCPFCGYEFEEEMKSMVKHIPKCKECKDGREYDLNNEFDERMIYLIMEKI